MTHAELLMKLQGIEWTDLEIKEAAGGMPKSVWESVCAFSNTAGGCIVLGVKERQTTGGPTYTACGLPNAEQMEQEFIGTLRSRTKFNALVTCRAYKYDIEGRTILAFDIPLSPHRPVAMKRTGDVYIRTGSGDTLASDLEVDAIARDCAFGTKSEMEVPDTSLSDLSPESLASYRSFLRDFNPMLPPHALSCDEAFCEKLNIVLPTGRLSYGSLLMFGRREAVLRALPNFWIDYMEVPAASYTLASERYTYRMPEQENIWESFLLIMRRLRNFVNAPYIEGPEIFGTEDNSQQFCLREGVVNFCAHADYFSAAHPTLRVFTDRIVMQNPGRFILGADEFRSRILSLPRNPSIIRFFRYAHLAENAGYGIDKMLRWESLTGHAVTFDSDILISTVVYPLADLSRQRGEINGENGEINDENGEINGEIKILDAIAENPTITQKQIAERTGFSQRKVNRLVSALRKEGRLTRIGANKTGHWEIK